MYSGWSRQEDDGEHEHQDRADDPVLQQREPEDLRLRKTSPSSSYRTLARAGTSSGSARWRSGCSSCPTWKRVDERLDTRARSAEGDARRHGEEDPERRASGRGRRASSTTPVGCGHRHATPPASSRADERAHELARPPAAPARRRRSRPREEVPRVVDRVDARRARSRRPSKPAASASRRIPSPRARRRCSRSRAPRSSATSAGTSPRTTTSDTAKRPPGFSTRNASRSTRSLSAERLMTQFEMMTSTRASGSGMLLDLALQELDVRDAGLPLVLARQGEHLVGHVEAVGLAGRADPARREQDVDAAARAEVEDRLARARARRARSGCRSRGTPRRPPPGGRASATAS